MSSERVRILLIMLVAVLALSVGETLLAKGMRQAGQAPRGWTGEVVAVLRSRWVGAGIALLGVHVVLYMAALSPRRPELRAPPDRGLVPAGGLSIEVLPP